MAQDLKAVDINSPIELIALTKGHIEKLVFKSGNNKLALSIGNQCLIQLFNSFCKNEMKNGRVLTDPGGFNSITKSEFDLFRETCDLSQLQTPTLATVLTVPSVSCSGTHVPTPAEIFKKGVKKPYILF